MLQASPTSWLSWSYTVTEGFEQVSRIDLAWVREAGCFDLDGRSYEIRREPMWGAFILRSSGSEIARARKSSAFSRSFSVTVDDATFSLEAVSAFQRKFVLREGGARLGEIRPAGLLSRKAVVDIRSEVPRSVQVFVLWLVVIMWRRQANAASSG
jgi:hypothetical protein